MKPRTLLLLLIVIVILSGCANLAPHPPLPADGPNVTVSVLRDTPGLSDYPIGAYTIPNSQVIVTKPRKISTLEGGFAVLGVMAAHSSGKKASKELVAGVENVLGKMLNGYFEEAIFSVADKSETAKYWSIENTIGEGGKIVLTPFAYLAPDSDGNGRLILFVKSLYLNNKGKKEWSSRYIYQDRAEYQIKGKDSWTSDSGKHFQEALSRGSQRIVKAMLEDTNRQVAGWSPKPAIIKSSFYDSEPMLLEGEIMKISSEEVIFNGAGGGPSQSLLHGINILPRASVEILSPLAKK